ncbi:MAG: hypothetical protein M3024_12335 [Candidatus Dormibacteraeota bacterium]|nr:hypothetical protein [Candidatus Dormibacteraeota bacterium]
MQQSFRDCNASVEKEVHLWAAAHGITSQDVEAVHGAMLERGRVLDEVEVGEVLGARRRGEP